MKKLYQEYKSTFSHNNVEYDLNKIFKIVHNKSIKFIAVSNLNWILKYQILNKSRVDKSNIDCPVIITKENNKYIIVDGIHRLQKIINEWKDVTSLNRIKIPYKYITKRELTSTLL